METKTVAQGRDGCTVTSASEVVFPIRKDYYHVRNDSENTVYASVFSAELDPAEDGVYAVPAGGNIAIKSHGSDRVYVSGGVTVIGTGSAVCPFKSAQRGGDITAKGNPVQLDGLQGGVPFSEITVSGKNLMPSDYMAKSGTYNGVTVIVKDNGRFDVSGTPTKSFALLTFTPSKYFLEGGKQYTFSCNHKYDINTFNIFARVYNKNGVQIQGISTYPTTITANDGDYFVWSLWAVENYEISATDVEVQLEYGTVATEYEPPITGRDLTVNVCGKNLMKPNKSTVTLNGITATMNDDGSVALNGTATANTYIGMWNNLYARSIGVGKITINAIDGQSSTTYHMGIDRCEGSSFINRIAQSITNNGVGEITQEDVENNRHFYVWVFIAANYTANNLVFRPQLELGDTATAYEPYHGSTTTITPDSNPYTVPNDIRQLDGLNNISVSAGTMSVTGVRKNAAIKRIWEKLDELTTAMIVSNGESE